MSYNFFKFFAGKKANRIVFKVNCIPKQIILVTFTRYKMNRIEYGYKKVFTLIRLHLWHIYLHYVTTSC